MAFLKALVAKVDAGGTRKVYVVGYSNGARLAYRVACTDPGLFTGYAMVKGVPQPGCALRKPVNLIQLASVDDPEIPYKPGDKGLEPLPVTTLMAQLHSGGEVPGQVGREPRRDMTLTTWSGVRERHPPRFRGVAGRRALLPAAARQQAGREPGHLVLLHQDGAGPDPAPDGAYGRTGKVSRMTVPPRGAGSATTVPP